MFSKSYVLPPLELTLDYMVLNYCLLDITCFTYATNVPCPVVKSEILILFKLKSKFCKFHSDQNSFYNDMPQTCEFILEQRSLLKKEWYSSREIKKKKNLQWIILLVDIRKCDKTKGGGGGLVD